MKKILVFLLIFTTFFIYAEDNTPETDAAILDEAAKKGFTMLPEEDPEALFELNIADTDVYLLLTGSWELDLGLGFGLGFLSGGDLTSSSAFSDMPQGFSFSQEPDLTLSLWIWDRFFIESYFSESQTPSSYLIGYQGKDDEALQYLAAGMSAMNIPDFPYQHFASGTVSAPGITGHVKWDNSDHHFILRYESASLQELVYSGTSEKEFRENSIDEYIRGRFFVLPDREIDNLSVYIEDQEGDYSGSWQGQSINFRQLTPDEAFISAETGRVYLNKPEQSIIAVSYTKNGNTVGDAALGRNFLPLINSRGIYDPAGTADFDFSASDPVSGATYGRLSAIIDGSPSLIINIPGETLPFELPLFYPLEGRTSNNMPTASIVYSGTEIIVNDVSSAYFVHHDEDTAQLRFPAASDYQNPVNRYPLYVIADGLYGPGGGSSMKYSIRESVLGATEKITLPEEYIPGSLQVYRNGTPTLNYTISGNILNLTPPPAANEEIRIICSTADESGLYGSLVAGIGSIFNLSTDLSSPDDTESEEGAESITHIAKAALGINWFMHNETMAVPGESLSGTIRFSGSHEYRDSTFSTKTAALVEFNNPNTAGSLLLNDFSGEDESVTPANITLRPGAAPDLSDAAGPILADSTRGKLLFKDYYLYSGFDTQGPLDISSTIPDAQNYSYEDGSKPGPYVALKDFKTRMVIDFEIDNSQEWVSAWLTRPGSNISGISDISFTLDSLDMNGGSVDIYMLAGALAEDIDGDGILDAETSEYSTGFKFNTGGMVLYPGAGPAMGPDFKISTEDINGNGVLDSRGNVISRQIANAISGDSSNTINISLSPLEQEAMREFRGLAFVVVKNTQDSVITPLSGKITIGEIKTSGSAIHPAEKSPYVHFSRETVSPAEYMTISDSSFDYSYINSDTSAAKISWDFPDAPSKQTINAGISIPENSSSLYQGLGLLVKAEQNASELTITFTDIKANSRSWTISTLPANEWVELNWKGSKPATLYLNNGTVITGTGDVLKADIAFAEVSINDQNTIPAGDGSFTGSILIDELTARNSRSFLATGANSSYRYAPDATLSIGEISVLSDFYLEQDYQLAADLPLSDTDNDIEHSEYVATRSGVSVLGNAIGGELIVDNKNSEDLQVFGGHTWNVALIPGFLNLSEDFFYTGPDFSHKHTAAVNLWGQAFNYESSISNDTKKNHSYKLGLKAGVAPVLLSADLLLSGNTDAVSFSESQYIQSLSRAYMLPDSFEQRVIDSNQSLIIFENTKLSNKFGLNNDSEKGQALTAESQISQSFEIFEQNWELFYRRKSIISLQDVETRDYYEDFQNLFAALPDHYGIAPGYDFIVIPANTEMTLNPELGLSMSRKYGSKIHDLFIPSKLSYSFEGELTAQNNVQSEIYTHTFATAFYAINIFGKYGTVPLFDFYETDDISWGVSGSISESKPSINSFLGYHTYKGDKEIFKLDTAVDVQTNKSNTLTLDGSYDLLFYWYPDWEPFNEGGEFINTETIAFQHNNPLGTEEANGSMGFKLGHTLKYRIPNMGYAEASLKAGLQFNDSGVYFNSLLSIHAVLRF